MKKELLDLLISLKERFDGIKGALKLEEKTEKLKKLSAKMEGSDFWGDQKNAQKISKEAARLESFVSTWQNIESSINDFSELIEISEENELTELEKEIKNLEKKFNNSEIEVFLSGEHDQKSVILTINTGTGGQDAEDFSQMLLRMYLRFCEKKGLKTKVLEESPSEAGLKSVMIEVRGEFPYGILKSENGVHRLIRLSPFNAKNLRQTSFSRVEVVPEVGDDLSLEIEEKDLRIDVFRSSGAGGQSVNTTDSAVRVTFLPLGLSVSCQNERSQLQNKETAMKILKSKLWKIKAEQKAEKISELRGEMMDNSFGSQIRTYTLQPYKLVKDHRTNFEHSNPDKVFDGDIEGFMTSFLRIV